VPYGAGLKGAVARATPAEVSTAGASEASDEERNEACEPSRLGLWK
jgi:hypothetical protein